MYKTTVLVICFMAIVLGPGSPVLADSIQLNKGALEMRTRGEIYKRNVSRNGQSNTQVNVSFGTGYFVTNVIEVFGDITYLFVRYDSDNTNHYRWSDIGGFIGVSANLPTSKSIVPFLSVAGGAIDRAANRESQSTKTQIVLPSVDLGARLFLSRYASINVSAYYEHTANFISVEDLKADEFGMRFGVSLYLRN